MVFECSYIHKIEKINNLSLNVFELNFYQVGNEWKPNLIPTEISKNGSDNVIDLLKCKNLNALIKNLGNYYEFSNVDDV